MSEETPGKIGGEESDPYSPYNVGILQFIMLGRIYDVLMTSLTATSPEIAKQILEIHQAGKLMGPPPNFDGDFLGASPEQPDL